MPEPILSSVSGTLCQDIGMDLTPDQFSRAVEYNKKELAEGRLTPEQITALVLEYQKTNNKLSDDGWCGPITRSELDLLLVREQPPRAESGVVLWDIWDGPEAYQPESRGDFNEYFGDPGRFKPSKAWERKNLVECHERYGNRLPGVPANRYIQVHRRVEPYLREALRRVQISCPNYSIERIACYVWRPIRNKRGNPLSVHSYAAAIDIDPHLNFTRTFPKGKAPKAWSDEYLDIWPNGLSPEFVQAFTSCGFAWGSDWDEDGFTHDHTFLDPMHFEWIARDGNSIGV